MDVPQSIVRGTSVKASIGRERDEEIRRRGSVIRSYRRCVADAEQSEGEPWNGSLKSAGLSGTPGLAARKKHNAIPQSKVGSPVNRCQEAELAIPA
jgi:hypothetical protein